MPIIKGLDKLIKYNDRSIKDLTTTPTAAGGGDTGALVHIKTLTASSSATLSFVHGTDGVVLDSTYPIYKFEFIDIHPATDNTSLGFQANAAGASGYNETITSTTFLAYHNEGDGDTALTYAASMDQAQGTAFQAISGAVGNDNDQTTSGELWLYGISSTTFVKHFMSTCVLSNPSDYMHNFFSAGYFNLTSALDEFQFKMSSGNIDSGKIKLYGILDS